MKYQDICSCLQKKNPIFASDSESEAGKRVSFNVWIFAWVSKKFFTNPNICMGLEKKCFITNLDYCLGLKKKLLSTCNHCSVHTSLSPCCSPDNGPANRVELNLIFMFVIWYLISRFKIAILKLILPVEICFIWHWKAAPPGQEGRTFCLKSPSWSWQCPEKLQVFNISAGAGAIFIRRRHRHSNFYCQLSF